MTASQSSGCRGVNFLCAQVFEGAPRPRLFLADFSELPRPTGRDATAANAPLVAAADRDLDSYLEARGDADIFFATDFDWLAKAYAAAGGVGAVGRGPAGGVLRAFAGPRGGDGNAVGIQPDARGLLEYSDLSREWQRGIDR